MKSDQILNEIFKNKHLPVTAFSLVAFLELIWQQLVFELVFDYLLYYFSPKNNNNKINNFY